MASDPTPGPSKSPLRGALLRLLRHDLLLAGLAAVLFVCLAHLSPPDMSGGIDFWQVHALYKEYMAKAILAGRLPLWNPHVNLGRPFHADSDAAMFYPPHAVYLLLDTHAAWAVLAIAHVWLAVAGTMYLLRAMGVARLLAFGLALGFVASGPLVEPFQNGLVHYAIGLCYLPWAFLFSLRLQDRPTWATAWKLALVVAMQYLGGHVQVTWLTLAGLSLFVVGRGLGRAKDLWAALGALLRVAGCSVWGLAIAAIQLLPLLEMAGQGNRHPSLAFTDSFRLPWFGWFSFLSPAGADFPIDHVFNLFCGAFVLMGGLLGLTCLRDRNVRGLLVVASAAVVAGAGNVTPLFRWAHAWVPGFSSFRLHCRALVLVTLALVGACGIAISRCQARPRPGTSLTRRLWIVGIVVLATTLCFELDVFPTPFPPSARQALARALFIIGAWALLYLLLRWQPGDAAGTTGAGRSEHAIPEDRRVLGTLSRRQAAVVTGLAALAGADLGVSIARTKPLRSHVFSDTAEREIAEILRVSGSFDGSGVPPRVSFPMVTMRPNAGMRFGFSTFAGYNSLTLDRTFAFMYGMQGLAEPLSNSFPASNIYDAGPIPYPGMSLVLGLDPRRRLPVLAHRSDPRAYVALAARVVPSWRDAIEVMRHGHDFHRTVLLEQPLSLPPAEPAESAEAPAATIRRFEPERIDILVDSPSPGLLVVGEAWYPGWKAKVNERPAPCLPGNAWMRVVPVPAGRSAVELTYSCTYLPLGAAISIVALLALAVTAYLARRREGRLAAKSPGVG